MWLSEPALVVFDEVERRVEDLPEWREVGAFPPLRRTIAMLAFPVRHDRAGWPVGKSDTFGRVLR